MSVAASPITLDVDLTNPGQFLACCGLFELASRMDPEAVAWFDESTFNVDCCAVNVLEKLLVCNVQPIGSAKTPLLKENGKPQESPPIHFGAPFNLLLDWWDDDDAVQAGFKTWAGGQTILGFVNGMFDHVRRMGQFDHGFLVRAPIAIEKPKPFYFDSRISRLTSLDLGFSAEKFTTAFSPAVELLSLIGLQRFRPSTVVQRERYAFAIWKEALPISVAAAVASGLILTLVGRRYQFPLVVRTGGKYKAFGPATLERSPHD
ncbi:MAG TPA: hypothetical protein VHV55_28030 [Pirellulales bacterium]|jgi:CRISPR-associated protein Csb3|nr:hypothetical protein [Pirellulales bacterium]